MAMTNKVFFENVIKANLSADMTDKAKALLATAENKSKAKAKAQTANAAANLAIARDLMGVMQNGVTYAVSEVKALAKSDLHPSKISACFKVAVDAGELVAVDGYKVGGKGRAVKGYSLPVAVADDDSDDGDDVSDVEDDGDDGDIFGTGEDDDFLAD